MTIWIDSRIGSGTPGDIVNYHPLNKIGRLTELRSADVAFSGSGPPENPVLELGVEIKDVRSGDLFSSLETNRLQAKQIPNMLRDYDQAWLLIIGDYRPTTEGLIEIRNNRDRWEPYMKVDENGEKYPADMPYAFVVARCTDIECAGVHIKEVPSIHIAALWVGLLWKSFSKPWIKRKGLHGFDTSRRLPLVPEFRVRNKEYDRKLKERSELAFSIKGLGTTRAMAVARHFDSIHSMINASIEDFKQVPGARIGDSLAAQIYNRIREK